MQDHAPIETETDSEDIIPEDSSGNSRRSGGHRRTSTQEKVSSSSTTTSKSTVSSTASKTSKRARKTPASPRKNASGEMSTRRSGRHTSKQSKKTPKSASHSVSSDVPSSDVEALLILKQQSDLIEKQTQLLTSLVEGQQRTITAIESMVSKDSGNARGTGVDALEVRPRIAIFVDVPNILYAAERAGVIVDWTKVAEFFARGRTLMRAIAYAPISDDPGAKREAERFVLPFLDKDYRIVTKPLKRFTGGAVKANFDVELAIDILTMADRLDVIGLVSGDGDFRRLVEIVGSHGVRVEVMAFGASTSKDIREVADRYIDIAAYVPELCQ